MEKLFTSPPLIECLSSLKSHHSKKELGHWQFQKRKGQRATRLISHLGNPSISVCRPSVLENLDWTTFPSAWSNRQRRVTEILKDRRARSKPLREKLALLVPSHSKFISCLLFLFFTVLFLFHRTETWGRQLYLAMSYGGRRGIRRLQNPIVSSGIVHRSSSPGVVELSKETSIWNSKILFC